MTTERACGELERLHAFADGELAGADADAMRDRLAGCAICQAELADLVQLDAAVAGRRSAVVVLAWYRQRRVQLAAAAAVAVAASVAIYLARPRSQPPAPEAVAIAVPLRAGRLIDARLAWSGAAGYRPFEALRDEQHHESIPLRALAELEQRGDHHGLGALELLNGERRQAAIQLERAGDSADVLSDRAALALADAQPEQALTLADAALAKAAGHRPALWNRALALQRLGLVRIAAAGFRELAARGEPGWADEARLRATALDADTDALEHRFERINQASVALARGQIELSVDDARAMPGFARAILYDAIRSAATPAQLDALGPLAEAIDATDRGTAMTGALARARAALHPALSRQYADMIRALAVEMEIAPKRGDERPVPAGAARKQLLAALRAARADDLLIGVLMKTSEDRQVVDRGEIAEFARLTAASPDPWMQLLGLQQQAEVALKQDDVVGAEPILLRAKQRCSEPGAPAFRCILIGRLLGKLYLEWQRLPEARAALITAWDAARHTGEWVVQDTLLDQLASLASIGDETEASGLPLVRAYTDEYVLRFPASIPDGRCDRAAWGRQLQAMLLINRLQFDAARRALVGPACAGPQDPERVADYLFVQAELASLGATAEEIAALRAQISELRASPNIRPAEQIVLDHSEGRLLVERDPAAGQALLRRAIEAAKAIPSSVTRAHKAAAWSYSVLVVAAARRGDGAAALALLSEEQGLSAPGQCVIGLAIEDHRRAIVARDATGKVLVRADDGRIVPAIDPGKLIPADIVAALSSCRVVDVIARPPVHGMARLLPDLVAWRYLSPRRSPAASPGGRTLVIADVDPPAALELPRLVSWSSGGERLTGAAATPAKVLAAIGSAGEVVIHAHGLVDVAQPDASFLALSADSSGRFALTTGDVRKAHFATSPLIILAACRASQTAPVWHEIWSLPAAFVYAGADAVIASAAPIPDADAAAFFGAISARVHTGVQVAVALRDVRRQWLDQRRGAWVQDVIVFE